MSGMIIQDLYANFIQVRNYNEFIYTSQGFLVEKSACGSIQQEQGPYFLQYIPNIKYRHIYIII